LLSATYGIGKHFGTGVFERPAGGNPQGEPTDSYSKRLSAATVSKASPPGSLKAEGFGHGHYQIERQDYCSCCLPVMASVSILGEAYSRVEPVARPRASRVIFTSKGFSSELI